MNPQVDTTDTTTQRQLGTQQQIPQPEAVGRLQGEVTSTTIQQTTKQKEPSKLDSKFKPEKEGYKIIIDKNGRQRYQKINIDPAVTEKRKQSMLAARQKLPEKREHIQEVKRRSYQQQQQLLQTVMDEKKQNELMRQQIQQLIDQSKQLEPLAQRVVERSKSREIAQRQFTDVETLPPQQKDQSKEPMGPQVPLGQQINNAEVRLSEEIMNPLGTQIIPDKWKQYWDQQRSNGILGK